MGEGIKVPWDHYGGVAHGCHLTCAFMRKGNPPYIYIGYRIVRVEPVTYEGEGVRGEEGAAPRHPREKRYTLET